MSETDQTSRPSPARQVLRSAAALLAGAVAVVVLSVGADAVLQALGIFPPEGQPMRDPALNLLALVYRTAFGVLGSWIAARLAPAAPMRHALALGAIGFLVSLAGVIVTAGMDLGPRWYPIALVVTALPGAWLGGRLAAPKSILEAP